MGGGGERGSAGVHTRAWRGPAYATPGINVFTYLEKAETITFLEPALPTFAPV